MADRGLLGATTEVLDVGCGSGILSIAAARLGAGRVLGVDVDPIAVDATRANARRNRLARRIRSREGSSPSGDGPFDLVLANLIASVLIAIADGLVSDLRPGGTLLASGIFENREADVTAAFRAHGLEIVNRWTEGEWVALEAHRPAVTGALRYDLAPMPDLSSLFPVILGTHITLAVCLLVPSLLLPFTLRNRSVAPNASPDQPGRVVRSLSWAQTHGTIVIGAGLALTGIGMIAVLGPRMLQQPWLLVSLATYAVVAVVAFAVQRPQLQSLQARDGIETDADRAAWRDRARRQRYMAYGLTSAVGLIGFLMSTKPQLW